MVSSVRDLDVYQRAYKTALNIHKLSLTFPKTEQYALADQMRRASKSMCANLAEGFAKGHKSSAEFKRYANIAIGSSEEMLVWIDFAKDLEYINNDQHKDFSENYTIICKQINTLSTKWK
ncbi:MAG: four helix bundle protein [Alphaproteobacteria bacterium]